MTKKLISNGFGSVRQEIYFTAPRTFRSAILNSGNFLHYDSEKAGDSARDTFVWTRWTTRPDDDETVAWTLRLLLGDITDDLEIMWGK